MSEVVPQLTFDSDMTLRIVTGLNEGFFDSPNATSELKERLVASRREVLETLAVEPGIVVDEVGGVAAIEIEIENRFRDSFNNQGDPDISEFLSQIDNLLPFYPEDSIDRVVSFGGITNRGSIAAINHHFQRWLNLPGLTEESARHSTMAMALPFGADYAKGIKKDFRYSAGDTFENASAKSSRIDVRNGTFGLLKLEEAPEANLEIDGEVDWRWLDMGTVGDCACWGVPGEERFELYVNEDSKRLYDMTPHNVDYARQSLSLLLGVGALAHFASQYDGQENIYANAEWKEPRSYPID